MKMPTVPEVITEVRMLSAVVACRQPLPFTAGQPTLKLVSLAGLLGLWAVPRVDDVLSLEEKHF